MTRLLPSSRHCGLEIFTLLGAPCQISHLPEHQKYCQGFSRLLSHFSPSHYTYIINVTNLTVTAITGLDWLELKYIVCYKSTSCVSARVACTTHAAWMCALNSNTFLLPVRTSLLSIIKLQNCPTSHVFVEYRLLMVPLLNPDKLRESFDYAIILWENKAKRWSYSLWLCWNSAANWT